MEFSKCQEEIVETKEKKVVVVSSAASGKTHTLIGRLNYLLKSGINPSKIVAITFTNAAAGEILERLNKPDGLFVGTVHSYANYLLLSSGVETQDILENEQFDKLFLRIKKHPESIKSVEHLLLDEAQDSTPEQFQFLLDCVCPNNWMFVGDWRQAIYGWAGADVKLLLGLRENSDVKTYFLKENYRNGRKILDYAKGIIRLAGIDYIDDSIPKYNMDGKVIDTTYNPLLLAREIKRRGDFKDWFILARTNSQVEELSRYFTIEKVPNCTFKKANFENNKDLSNKLNEDSVKILTIHTSKGLEAKNVVVIGAKFYNTEEKCVSYVAATRAKELLVWCRLPNKTIRRESTSNWER